MSKNKRKQKKSDLEQHERGRIPMNTSFMSKTLTPEVAQLQDQIQLDNLDQNVTSTTVKNRDCEIIEEVEICDTDLENKNADNLALEDKTIEQSIESENQIDSTVIINEDEIEKVENTKIKPVELHFTVNSKPVLDVSINESTLDLLARGYGPK